MTTATWQGRGAKTLFVIRRFEAEIARDASDAYAYDKMGLWWHWEEHYSKAFELYNIAIRLDPHLSHALCARASLLATCPDPKYRDGASAVRDATTALDIARKNGELHSDWLQRMYLQTLAAAHAEHGDFEQAVRFQHEALEYSVTMRAYYEVIGRLKRFHARQPARERFGLVRYGIVRKVDA